jgi:hypothetical protein
MSEKCHNRTYAPQHYWQGRAVDRYPVTRLCRALAQKSREHRREIDVRALQPISECRQIPRPDFLIHARRHEDASHAHPTIEARPHTDVHAVIIRRSQWESCRHSRCAMLRCDHKPWCFVSRARQSTDIIYRRAISVMTALMRIPIMRNCRRTRQERDARR